MKKVFLSICMVTMVLSVQSATKLKLAHVYEKTHPFSKWAIWAGKEIEKRSQGKVQVNVFANSSLGNEQQLNEGLGLGTADIVYTGAAFASQFYSAIAISDYPYIIRDYEHWKKYSKSPLFWELAEGYKKVTSNEILAALYFGSRDVISSKVIKEPKDMKGMKVRVPNAPVYKLFIEAVGANAAPIAYSETYLALQQGVVDAAENPLPSLKSQKFYEVRNKISRTGHIVNTSLIILSPITKRKLTKKEYEIVKNVMQEAADKSSDQIYNEEVNLVDWFEKQGIGVNKVDKAKFQKKVRDYLKDKNLPYTADQAKRLSKL